MKRILIVTGPIRTGGLEKVAINCMKYSGMQHSFDFLTLGKEKGELEKEVEELGGRIFKVPFSSNPLRQFHTVYKFLKSNGTYDIIHSHLFFNSVIILMAAFFAGIKVRIAHVHSIKRNDTSLTKECLYNIMRPFFRLFTTTPCACSSEAGNYVFGMSFFNKKGVIIPNIVDIDKFSYSESDRKRIREELSISLKTIVVGQIGRLVKVKNQELLLYLFSKFCLQNTDSKLLLIGDGNLRQKLVEIAEQLKIQDKLIFTGTRKDTPALLSAMDVFVCTSTNEGLGIVLLEAQANGLPCVASTDAIVAEIKQLGNCMLVDNYNNIDDWVTACNNALTKGRNPEVVIKLRKSIFTVDELRKIIQALY